MVCSYDLSKNINTGNPSGIENATATVSFRMDGNLTGDTVIPFKLATNNEFVKVNISATDNGTVTVDKPVYTLGDTVTLTVTPVEGYCQKLYINGEPMLLDWKTNT